MLTFDIPIDPVAKGRPRISMHGGTFTPKKTRDFENAVKLYLKLKNKCKSPISGALSVSIVFHVKRPKSVPASKRPWPSVKPDLDNLVKGVLDCLNGLVIEDDASVVCLMAEKRYASKGSIWICISEY